MGLGEGIAIAGSVCGIGIPMAAVWITVIKNRKSQSQVCPLHSGIEVKLEYLAEGIDEIKDILRNGD